MTVLRNHKRDWDELADLDPLWAVLSAPEGKFGGWDLNQFFRTGQEEVREILSQASGINLPGHWRSALDFGCAVGRLTRVLASHFQQCTGVDISEQMVQKARQLNRSFANCTFLVNAESNLRIFPDNSFDFILTDIVLQHLPTESVIRSYIAEFIRVLANDGLLVFQLPSFIPFRHRLQIRRRAYSLLRNLGVSHRFLYRKLTLNPIRMNFISQAEIISHVDKLGGKVRLVNDDRKTAAWGMQGKIYYVSKSLCEAPEDERRIRWKASGNKQ